MSTPKIKAYKSSTGGYAGIAKKIIWNGVLVEFTVKAKTRAEVSKLLKDAVNVASESAVL